MTENTQRSWGGDQTVWAPRRRPATTSFATASAVVAKGLSSMPSVMAVRTNPGRTTITPAPVPASESPRPWANASSPALVEP